MHDHIAGYYAEANQGTGLVVIGDFAIFQGKTAVSW